MDTTENLFIYYLTLHPHYQEQANWTGEALKTIEEHAAFLDNLGKEGILAFAGRTLFEPGHANLFGIAVIKAESLEAAHEILDPDPAVVNQIQQAAIYPFRMGIRHLHNLQGA